MALPEDSEPARRHTVIIADDHAMYRDGVAMALEHDGRFEVVASVADGQAAIEQFERLRPDVVILDLEMPKVSGLDALRRIKVLDGATKVVILTTYGLEGEIQRCLAAGANGYVLKDVDASEFIKLLLGVIAGKRRLSAEVATTLVEQHRQAALTPTEQSVLEAIKDGLSNRQIAARLGVTEGTVRIHTSHLFDKLGASRRTEAVAIAVKRGLVRRD